MCSTLLYRHSGRLGIDTAIELCELKLFVNCISYLNILIIETFSFACCVDVCAQVKDSLHVMSTTKASVDREAYAMLLRGVVFSPLYWRWMVSDVAFSIVIGASTLYLLVQVERVSPIWTSYLGCNRRRLDVDLWINRSSSWTYWLRGFWPCGIFVLVLVWTELYIQNNTQMWLRRWALNLAHTKNLNQRRLKILIWTIS